MPDIFLSYSRDDQRIARRFAEGLACEGFDVWWDQTLHSGDPYDRITEQALKDAKATVVLWSPSSVESRWVRAEATMADRLGTLLPVMIGPCQRPLRFELTQAPDLSQWKGNRADPAWREFIADIRRRMANNDGETVASPPIPREAPAARAWTRRGAWTLALLLLGAGAWLLLPRNGAQVAGRVVSAASAGNPVSIAVLPFVDMTATGADAPLGEGLAEEISNWLAQVPRLQVVARTSSFMFKGDEHDVREIGRRLGATHVIEGSVRRGGDKVRVTVQLIATADGYHIWSRTFDLQETDALRIEDAVSRSVVRALDYRLTNETERRWTAQQSRVPEAYQLYLAGRAEQRLRTAEHNLIAMDLYRQAIERDAGFAPALVGLAEATLNSVPLNGRELSAVAPDVTALLDRADALHPGLPATIAVRGWLAMDQYRNADALALMRRAVELNPNDADTQRRLGDLQARLAQPREAAAQFALAAELDPLDFMTHVNHCLSLQDLAEFAAAEQACARARELASSNPWGPLATSYLEFGRGNLVAALGWLDRALALAPDMAGLAAYRVMLLQSLGRYDEAQAEVARLPGTAGAERAFLGGSIAAARQDSDGLSAALRALELRSPDFGVAEWVALARLQLAAGEVGPASQSLARARQLPGWNAAALAQPDDACQGYMAAMIVAGVQVAAGQRDDAMRLLDQVDGTLDRMQQGGAACSGLYSLRAESLAMRGEAEPAMASLRMAYDRGWRQSVSARTEPYLQSLRDRSDFTELLAMTDRELQRESSSPDNPSR